ncbi:3-hydroxybutyrate dehydrogenase [Geobacter sp.]|uniref:3-hydroxybutyrate dehydrogenase n=1 Tax=Geobacter sp. TaxID=46610 RepID=UPI002602DBA1|nr:3-hydroxybutyrate dehydrogenase [Geobacter sp.]
MLNGKSALITGSTSGIGLGIARTLAAQGCNVMLNGFGAESEIEKIRSDLSEAHGVAVSYHGADMRSPTEIADLVRSAESRFGGVDILVNNAGIQHTAPIEEFPPETWDAIIAINLSSAFHTIHHALPGMRRRGWGRIVNTASVHGLVASANKAGYIAAKHGLVGLTKEVALETAGSGVTCNAICPGWTRTELIEPQIAARARAMGVDLEEGGRHLLAEKQPSRQFVTVEQLGQLVVFLCSEAADQITGTAIPVDGGWTAQ